MRGRGAGSGSGDDDEEEEGDAKGEGGGKGSKRKAAKREPGDVPGGLGEYDPHRAEMELKKRQDARQDIKAAHKAMIQAQKGMAAERCGLAEM